MQYPKHNVTSTSSWPHSCTRCLLHGRMPRCLSGDCQLISDASRRLRSSDTFTFAVPRTRTRLGDRTFAVSGPQIWNSLPANMRLVDNYARFRRLLKGNMFGWGCGAYSDSVLFLGAVHKYTYLLIFTRELVHYQNSALSKTIDCPCFLSMNKLSSLVSYAVLLTSCSP